MDTKVKAGTIQPKLPPEPEPMVHRGRIIPTPEFASVVRRNGKVIRRGGQPVEDGEDRD